MAQDRNLPEGTDKIIAGASGSSGTGSTGAGTGAGEEVIVAETTIVAAAVVPTGSSAGGGRSDQPGSSTSGAGGQSMKEKVRASGEKLSGQAADKARDLVGQGLEKSGDALTSVSRLVGDTAAGLDERLGAEYGDYARRAADSIDNVARNLRTKDPDELIEDTRNLVRKSPGVALAGAAIVGFALARLVKSGLDATRGEGGEGSDSDQGRGGRSTGSTDTEPGGGAA